MDWTTSAKVLYNWLLSKGVSVVGSAAEPAFSASANYSGQVRAWMGCMSARECGLGVPTPAAHTLVTT